MCNVTHDKFERTGTKPLHHCKTLSFPCSCHNNVRRHNHRTNVAYFTNKSTYTHSNCTGLIDKLFSFFRSYDFLAILLCTRFSLAPSCAYRSRQLFRFKWVKIYRIDKLLRFLINRDFSFDRNMFVVGALDHESNSKNKRTQFKKKKMGERKKNRNEPKKYVFSMKIKANQRKRALEMSTNIYWAFRCSLAFDLDFHSGVHDVVGGKVFLGVRWRGKSQNDYNHSNASIQNKLCLHKLCLIWHNLSLLYPFWCCVCKTRTERMSKKKKKRWINSILPYIPTCISQVNVFYIYWEKDLTIISSAQPN